MKTNNEKRQLSKSFLFGAIQFRQTVLIQTIQFSISNANFSCYTTFPIFYIFLHFLFIQLYLTSLI